MWEGITHRFGVHFFLPSSPISRPKCQKNATSHTVGMNIPVDPPRFSKDENSRAVRGDIHRTRLQKMCANVCAHRCPPARPRVFSNIFLRFCFFCAGILHSRLRRVFLPYERTMRNLIMTNYGLKVCVKPRRQERVDLTSAREDWWVWKGNGRARANEEPRTRPAPCGGAATYPPTPCGRSRALLLGRLSRLVHLERDLCGACGVRAVHTQCICSVYAAPLSSAT